MREAKKQEVENGEWQVRERKEEEERAKERGGSMATTDAIPERKGVRRLPTPYHSLPTPSGGRKATKEGPSIE